MSLALKLETVESSMIHAVGYDPEKRILEIVFNSGRTYQYWNVPSDVYEGLMQAESKGSYFRSVILDMFEYKRIGR